MNPRLVLKPEKSDRLSSSATTQQIPISIVFKSSPLTSNTGKCYPSEAVVTFNNTENKAMADQIATVDKQRLQNCAGSISNKDMKQVERTIKVQLGLPL